MTGFKIGLLIFVNATELWMKRFITTGAAVCALAIMTRARSEEAKSTLQYAADQKLYEAIVSERKIAIFYSQEPFDPAKHKITQTKVDGRVDRIAVDGKTLVGVHDEAMVKAGVQRVTALHVMFGNTRVDVPQEILQPISFLPLNATFTAELAETLVTISSDTKTVAIEFRGGRPPLGSGEATVIAVADNGRVTSHDARHYPVGFGSREFMAVIQDPDGFTNVRDGKQGRIIGKIKTGEQFIAIEDTSDDWWRVILPSAIEGVIHRSRVHLLPEEPLMKLPVDIKKFFHALETRVWDVEGPAPGYPANYIGAIRKAVSGDLKGLAQLFEKGRFKYADGAPSPDYRINWTVFHLVGDETFARFVRSQPQKRVEEIADAFSDPDLTYPASEPLPYMQRHFPKSHELLYPSRSDIESARNPQQGYAQDQKFYEAIFSGKQIALFYSEQGFEVPTERRKYDPTLAGIPELSALRVVFGDKRVDLPAEYLRNVFCPWMQTRFVHATAATRVSISSDAKTVVLNIADRPGHLDPYHRYAIFIVTDEGTVISRSSLKVQQPARSKAFMAAIEEPSSHVNVRYAGNPTSGITATLKNGERLITIGRPDREWWNVWLTSGQQGFVARKSLRELPDEPLMSIRYDGEYVLEHETLNLDHAGWLHGVNYEVTAKSAAAGDTRALARLLTAGPLMDDDSIEAYWKAVWIVMHRLGDEAFASSLASQPGNAVADIGRGFSNPSITAPFSDSSSYLKRNFPKTHAVLFP